MTRFLHPPIARLRSAARAIVGSGGQPSGRAIGIAMAVGVVIGSGGGVILEISAVSGLLVLLAGGVISTGFSALRRYLDISDTLAESAETARHEPVLIPVRRPRR